MLKKTLLGIIAATGLAFAALTPTTASADGFRFSFHAGHYSGGYRALPYHHHRRHFDRRHGRRFDRGHHPRRFVGGPGYGRRHHFAGPQYRRVCRETKWKEWSPRHQRMVWQTRRACRRIPTW